MAAATTSVPLSTENVQQSPAGIAGKDPGTVPIQPEYVASEKRHLPAVILADEKNRDEMDNMATADWGFWSKSYAAARSAQTEQAKLIQEIRKLQIQRQTELGFRHSLTDFQKGTEEMQKLMAKLNTYRESLEEINEKISDYQIEHEEAPDFGFVRSYPLLKPVLAFPECWSAIEETSTIRSAFAEGLYKAYNLQLYRNDYLVAIEQNVEGVAYEKEFEDKISVGLSLINKDFWNLLAKRMRNIKMENLEVWKVLKADSKKLHVYVCVQGDPPMNLDDPECEPPEDDVFDDKMIEDKEDEEKGKAKKTAGDKEKKGMYYTNPDEPVRIEEKGTGSGGQTEKPPLPKEINDIRKRMGGGKGPLHAYVIGIVNGKEDLQARKQLEDLGDEVDAYCLKNGIHNKTYQMTWEYIMAFSEIIKEARDIYDIMKEETTNQDAQIKYIALRQRAGWFLENNQMPENFLDALVPSTSEVEKMINRHIDEKKHHEEMDTSGGTLPLPPIVVDEQAKQTSYHQIRRPEAYQLRRPEASQLKPPSTNITRKQAGGSAAPPADSDDQFVETSSSPGFVTEMKGKTSVCKRITGWLDAGRGGHQILLKSQGTNPDFNDRYIYEIVAARKFGTAREEYMSAGGTRMITAGAKFLKEGNKMWSKAKIGGVAIVRRDPEKDYANEAVAYILMKFIAQAPVWIARTYLAFRFGEAQVQAQMLQYMMEAGQVRSKKPTLTRKTRNFKSNSKPKSKWKADSISVEEDGLDDDEGEEEEDTAEEFSDIIDDSEDTNKKSNKMANEMLDMKKMMSEMNTAIKFMAEEIQTYQQL